VIDQVNSDKYAVEVWGGVGLVLSSDTWCVAAERLETAGLRSE
jgi:extradiol dioxygenase family protein